VVNSDEIAGMALSVGVVETGDYIRGLALAGYKVESWALEGVSLAVIRTKTRSLTGLSIAGYNQVKGRQEGLSIGLYNRARLLTGIQIGLLNYVGNNPPWLRYLPLLNLHFD
jgi:hypothetical protein